MLFKENGPAMILLSPPLLPVSRPVGLRDAGMNPAPLVAPWWVWPVGSAVGGDEVCVGPAKQQV